ncbi:hypothetical protein VP01_7739g1, partial [Puccinia sorghi]
KRRKKEDTEEKNEKKEAKVEEQAPKKKKEIVEEEAPKRENTQEQGLFKLISSPPPRNPSTLHLQMFSYCVGWGKNDFLAVRNKFYQNTKQRIPLFKNNSFINLQLYFNPLEISSPKNSNPCYTSFSQSFFPHFCPPKDNTPIFIGFLSPFKHFVVHILYIYIYMYIYITFT